MKLDDALAAAVEAACGRAPVRLASLPGGCIATVVKVELAGGGAVVAKLAPAGGLACEAAMLAYLAAHTQLPLPTLLHSDDRLLLMEFVETGGGLDTRAQEHAADLLAALHGITAPAFGFERDTVIGPLPQPNPWNGSWLAFFREQRLRRFAHLAAEAGRLPAETLAALERFCETRLERFIAEPAAPALIHGDLWGGNVLFDGDQVAAFVDPAIYYADPEIELAFSTLFGTFGEPFFARYREQRPLAAGFFEARRDLYNLYPLLVHTRLFGGGYAASVAAILARYG